MDAQPPDNQEDAALARRAAADPRAFDALYRRHVKRIYRYALSRTGNVEDAQDLTAQTFTAALRGISRYRGDGTVIAWLLSIAHNLSASQIRTAQPTQILDENIPAREPSPEEVAGRTLRLDAILRALELLPPEQAEIIRLRLFSELSTAETANLLGKSEAAVKMGLHRALRTLRQWVDEQEPVEL